MAQLGSGWFDKVVSFAVIGSVHTETGWPPTGVVAGKIPELGRRNPGRCWRLFCESLVLWEWKGAYETPRWLIRCGSLPAAPRDGKAYAAHLSQAVRFPGPGPLQNHLFVCDIWHTLVCSVWVIYAHQVQCFRAQTDKGTSVSAGWHGLHVAAVKSTWNKISQPVNFGVVCLKNWDASLFLPEAFQKVRVSCLAFVFRGMLWFRAGRHPEGWQGKTDAKSVQWDLRHKWGRHCPPGEFESAGSVGAVFHITKPVRNETLET